MNASLSEPRALSGPRQTSNHRSARSSRYGALSLAGLLGVLINGPVWSQAPIVFSQGLEPTADDLPLATEGFFSGFGEAVAISGSTAMVGLPEYGVEEAIGRVGVYTRTAQGWLRTATISNPEPGQLEFGRAIALDGDSAVIAADSAAYLFRNDGEQWRLVTTFVTSDPAESIRPPIEYSNGFMASSIARAGERPGLVHLYRHDEDDARLVARLCASDRAPQDQFGESLAMDPGVLLVGAPGLAAAVGLDAAYVFMNDGQRWVQRQKLVRSNGDGGFVAFGSSVAISDGIILVGAPRVDLPNLPSEEPPAGHPSGSEGEAYVFLQHEGTWFESQRLNEAQRSNGVGLFRSEFGMHVALSPQLAAVVTNNNANPTRPRSAVIAFDRVGAELTSGRGVLTSSEDSRVADIDVSERRLVIGVASTDFNHQGGDRPRAVVLEFGTVGAVADDGLAAAPGNDSIDGNQNGEGAGGGSIDALLAILLAQLAFARALRQRAQSRESRREVLA